MAFNNFRDLFKSGGKIIPRITISSKIPLLARPPAGGRLPVVYAANSSTSSEFECDVCEILASMSDCDVCGILQLINTTVKDNQSAIGNTLTAVNNIGGDVQVIDSNVDTILSILNACDICTSLTDILTAINSISVGGPSPTAYNYCEVVDSAFITNHSRDTFNEKGIRVGITTKTGGGAAGFAFTADEDAVSPYTKPQIREELSFLASFLTQFAGLVGMDATIRIFVTVTYHYSNNQKGSIRLVLGSVSPNFSSPFADKRFEVSHLALDGLCQIFYNSDPLVDASNEAWTPGQGYDDNGDYPSAIDTVLVQAVRPAKRWDF